MTTHQRARELGVIGHYYCEDSWYSCPLAEGGCADGRQEEDKCNCGYDERIKKIATALEEEIEACAVAAENTAAGFWLEGEVDVVANTKLLVAAAIRQRKGARHVI